MLRPVKHEWLTCTGRWLREGCSGTEVASKTAFPMTSHNVEAGDLRRRPKQRSACSTFKEDLGWCHRNGWLCPPHYRCSPQSHRYQESTPAQRAIAQRFRPMAHSVAGHLSASEAYLPHTPPSHHRELGIDRDRFAREGRGSRQRRRLCVWEVSNPRRLRPPTTPPATEPQGDDAERHRAAKARIRTDGTPTSMT